MEDSLVIVDIENPKQTGLTMRTIEIIGMRKKMITTNMDIVNYDFYNRENILVLDRDNPVIDENFLSTSYKQISEELYKKYSLENWISDVLGL